MRSITVQLVAVSLIVAACSYAVIERDLETPFNLLWMVGLPVGVAISANKRAAARTLMACALLLCSCTTFTAMVTLTGWP